MAYFVIAGKPDCPTFVHAIYVARYIGTKLPNFSTNIVQKKQGKWEPWLLDINIKNKWAHASSPLIWKELAMRGSKPHYLGGLTPFWEYCFDYYGLQSVLSTEDLQLLVADNMQYFQEMENEAKKAKVRKIGIFGCNNPMLPTLILELNQVECLKNRSGIRFYLYDIKDTFEDTLQLAEDLLNDIKHLIVNGDKSVLKCVDKMQDMLPKIELLIILGDYSKREDEDNSNWLLRNMSVMYQLADEINAFAKRDLRVVVAIDGPRCFDATVLADTCTGIRIQNIVAITSDVGFGPLKYASEQAKVDLKTLGAPPVWGYIGINEFVDIGSAILRADIYRPYQRVIRNKGGSTLPLGTVQIELRFMNYLVNDVETALAKAERGRNIARKELHRPPMLSKIRALVSLLSLWYAKGPCEDVISLGVCSNGSYDISGGIVFSQPATLSKNMWIPFKNFPVSDYSNLQIQNVYQEALQFHKEMRIGSDSDDTTNSYISDSYI